MSEIYAFLFCLGLGLFSRFLYMGASKLAERTDIYPVTIVLDILTVAIVGAAFSLYIILTSSVIAPYMFAALLGGYYICYRLTRSRRNENAPAHSDKSIKK